jgi:hypothetical protein
MNAPHEEAVEFAKISKRENRVYVGNLSYDVKYRDLMEFMRGGGWGNLSLVFRSFSWRRGVEAVFGHPWKWWCWLTHPVNWGHTELVGRMRCRFGSPVFF